MISIVPVDTKMKMIDVIQALQLGNSVAEFDESLEKYFVETEAFAALVENRIDVVAGDKGTGKTALFRVLSARYRSIDGLQAVELVSAFNPSGNPVFQRLVSGDPLTEGQYRSVWKAYFLSLVGNWALNIAGADTSIRFARLDKILSDCGLRANDDTPPTIFGKIINSIRRMTNPKAAEAKFTFSETGIPIVIPRLEFGQEAEEPIQEITHEEALRLLDECLKEMGIVVWVMLDRLDEAFQGFPDFEIPALRALFRCYLDMLEFESVRLKVFVRKDLFRRIISGGFVNLTHINARKTEIVWDEDDLLNLLCQRIRQGGEFLKIIDAQESSNEEVFNRVFPGQVDVGSRKPTTWNWIMSRIRDGNNIKPPRNLIDLVSKSREAQLRRENREAREYSTEQPVIEADSIRRGLARLSEERVEDTLLAEAGEDAEYVEKFRGNKSEQNISSIANLLEMSDTDAEAVVQRLQDLGFIERIGGSYKIPMLYREGLGVTQGKAF